MARFVQSYSPLQHGSIGRRSRASSLVGTGTAVGAVLFLLSVLGTVVLRAAARLQAALHTWSQARREEEEDRKLWELALSDARVMADLVAIGQQAERDVR